MLLASQSPRRRRLLAWLGVPFESTHVDTPEELDSPLASDPRALAEALAADKATAARDEGHAGSALTLCFDTIVVLDGTVLGKPRDEPDAWRMLRSLSGRTHQVATGCAVLCPEDDEPSTFSVVTNVAMQPLSDCRIEAWMAMGTFMGCAGAYNIEAQVAQVADDECYQNVAGLPLCHVYARLRQLRGACAPQEMAVPVGPCDRALSRRCRLGPVVTG